MEVRSFENMLKKFLGDLYCNKTLKFFLNNTQYSFVDVLVVFLVLKLEYFCLEQYFPQNPCAQVVSI